MFQVVAGNSLIQIVFCYFSFRHVLFNSSSPFMLAVCQGITTAKQKRESNEGYFISSFRSRALTTVLNTLINVQTLPVHHTLKRQHVCIDRSVNSLTSLKKTSGLKKKKKIVLEVVTLTWFWMTEKKWTCLVVLVENASKLSLKFEIKGI